MSFKNKIQLLIAKKFKSKKHNTKRNSTAKNESTVKSTVSAFWSERIALFAALFFFSFGMGLISDGKKIYAHQLKVSQRVDYKATLNTYSTN